MAALAYLQQPDALDHFWRKGWHGLPSRFWGVVYDGMRRADPDLALTFVPAAAARWRSDPDGFHPGEVWARILAHVTDGPQRLAEAARDGGTPVVTAVSDALQAVEPPAELLNRFRGCADVPSAEAKEQFWAQVGEASPPAKVPREPLGLVA